MIQALPTVIISFALTSPNANENGPLRFSYSPAAKVYCPWRWSIAAVLRRRREGRSLFAVPLAARRPGSVPNQIAPGGFLHAGTPNSLQSCGRTGGLEQAYRFHYIKAGPERSCSTRRNRRSRISQ